MSMQKIGFHRKFYEKFHTSTIYIWPAILDLENCGIIQKENTRYDYHKAIVKLSPEKVIEMKKIEEMVNEYLEKEEGLSQIKLVYGNRVYPKIKILSPKTIKLKVCGSTRKKLYPQLWLE